jgi:hypothetical protein
MNERDTGIFNKLKTIGSNNKNISVTAILGFKGGNNKINFGRIEKNDYKIQVFISYDFDVYEKIRTEICALMAEYNTVLSEELDCGSNSFGVHKELIFMDKEKHNSIMKQEEEERMQQGKTVYNIDNNTITGNFNTGNAERIDNSTTNNSQTEDSKWFQKTIVKEAIAFVFGVGATLFAQWIMRLLGWI